MPPIYKLLTSVLAFTGCASLFVTGGVNPLMTVGGIGLFPGYYRFFKGKPPAPKWVVGGLSILTILLFFFDSLVISNDYFLGVAHLTITFQAIKSFDLKNPWDHLQVYFMALLQLIIASELTHSVVFGFIFVLFLMALVAAMVLSHFVKEGTLERVRLCYPVPVISLLTLVFTLVFFISIPRVSGRMWGKSHTKGIRTVGFSERVDFGSYSDIKLDPTVIMRVELTGDHNGTFYWRGMTLDHFDGLSWSNTLQRSRIFREEGLFRMRPFEKERAVRQWFFVEPMDTDVIFGLADIAAVEANAYSMQTDAANALYLPAKMGKRFNYVAYSIVREPDLRDDVSRYLQLPEGIEKISQLARGVVERSDTDEQKARKIEQYLLRNFSYSLSPPPPPKGVSPLDDFLFNARKGFCEHYATAMVLMLRALDIPARIATGFVGGEVNEYGGYVIVRQSDAHSWVEAAVNGVWMRFDPTPPVSQTRPSRIALFLDSMRMKWSRYIIAFSISDQQELARVVSLPFRLPIMPEVKGEPLIILLPASFLAGIVTLIIVLKRLRWRRYGPVTARYVRLRDLVRRRGGAVSLSSTPDDVRREAEKVGMNGSVAEFIHLYEDHRFGGLKMSGERRSRFERLFTEISK
ncbi:MAG: DUF3488 and transglutaminase-like domain-containing protein [Nitrospirota bacterium]